MWKYIKKYLAFAILAALFMIGEVSMDLIQPGIMSSIVDDGVLGLDNGGVGDLHLILICGIQMAAFVLFGGLCGALNNLFVHMSGQNIGNDIRKDCFRRIMGFSFSQTDRFSTGSLVTRVTNDITQVQNLVSQFVRGMIRTVMLTFGSIFCMFQLSSHIGIIALCAFPLLAGCLVFCMCRADPLFDKLQSQLDTINSIMQEDISGIRMIKACVRETYEKVRFGKANGELIKTQLKVLMIFAFMNPVINVLMYVVVTLILLVGSFDVSGGTTTPGVIMAAITYTTQLLNGILMLVMLIQNISRGTASWRRVKEVLNCELELADGSFTGETSMHGKIEFRNVSFTYPDSDKQVLEHINLTINSGETIAVMGATGCGKTTLVNLISRFYDVTDGAVLVDGVDVREYSIGTLRKKISVTLQKSELFSTTIGENIRWGDPSANNEKIKQAAVTARADEFISSQSNGYDTMVAERGTSLSGGQKQRISIARALLKPAEIRIFDDSTSALDFKTEAEFHRALKEFDPQSTKIMIAQRIASVRGADRIIVLENGKITGCGTHTELLENCAAYQEIFYSQMRKEEKVNERAE